MDGDGNGDGDGDGFRGFLETAPLRALEYTLLHTSGQGPQVAIREKTNKTLDSSRRERVENSREQCLISEGCDL